MLRMLRVAVLKRHPQRPSHHSFNLPLNSPLPDFFRVPLKPPKPVLNAIHTWLLLWGFHLHRFSNGGRSLVFVRLWTGNPPSHGIVFVLKSSNCFGIRVIVESEVFDVREAVS